MSAVLTASSVVFEFPNGRELFSNLNFTLETKLYSLVGPNGVGKTTLARLLSGELEVSSGKISRKGKIEFLPQRVSPSEQTVEEFLLSKREFETAYSVLNETLLEEIDPETPCSRLSGGQWMRVRLAAALSSGAEFLILDEPTNDLDRGAREAVIDFLSNVRDERRCGVLLISHDREILSLSESILELSNRGLTQFGIGWEEYLFEKENERGRLGQNLERARSLRDGARDTRQEEKEKQEKRNKRGAKHGASGSLPKILAGGRKRHAQVSTGKVDVATLEKSQRAVTDAYEAFSELKIDPVMYAEFESAKIPSQKLVAQASDFNLRYTGDWLYRENLNFAWRGNVRVAIKGSNGSGKSTLLKALIGKVLNAETKGNLQIGKIHTLYLDQRCEAVDDSLNVFENIRAGSKLSDTEIRNGLARFLFMKESVFQTASDLSGGERLRLALAIGFLSGEIPELLVLDEPTNNLDLMNIEFLERVVSAFQGALIVISHDEVFLENIRTNLTCNL